MCVFIWFVGRDGTPTSAPRWGQTGGGRVRVSSPNLRSAGPLQRSKIIRNHTPFLAPLRTFSFILLTVVPFCPPPVLSSSKLPFALSRGHYLISFFFAKLDCDLEPSSLHVLLSSKSNSLRTHWQFVLSCSEQAAYF